MEDIYGQRLHVKRRKAGRMAAVEWRKLCEDCGFFEPDKGRRFPGSGGRHLPQGVRDAERHRGYVDFRWLLDLSAEAKGVSYAWLCKAVLRSGGLMRTHVHIHYYRLTLAVNRANAMSESPSLD